jgi:hypothetical protein
MKISYLVAAPKLQHSKRAADYRYRSLTPDYSTVHYWTNEEAQDRRHPMAQHPEHEMGGDNLEINGRVASESAMDDLSDCSAPFLTTGLFLMPIWPPNRRSARGIGGRLLRGNLVLAALCGLIATHIF